jgi:ATP-grasp ribosomal peptide maturase
MTVPPITEMTTEPQVLIITCIEDVTADLVIARLNERRVPVARVDPPDLGIGLTFSALIEGSETHWRGRLSTASRTVDLDGVRSVYFRRPSPWRFSDLPLRGRAFSAAEARYGLGGVLASLTGCLYVNHPAAVARCDFKPVQLTVAAEIGFSVPATLITNDLQAARAFAAEHAPVVYKTFRGVPADADGMAGTVWTQQVDAAELDESVSVTAHMFQARIAKAADVRVTVVGRQIFATIVSNPDHPLDWRAGDWEKLSYVPITVPEPVCDLLHRFLERLGLSFGCFDLAIDSAGRWVWIECNANGQWGFLPDYDEIADAFAALLQRGCPL